MEITEKLPQIAVDGPWRVESYRTELRPLRSGGDYLLVNLLEESALGFYGEFQSTLRHLVGQATSGKLRDSIELIAFNRRDALDELAKLRRPKLPEELLESSGWSLGEILEALMAYCDGLEEALRKTPYGLANKKFDLLLLPCFEDDFHASQTGMLLQKFLERAAKLRVVPVLLATDPAIVDSSISELISTEIFLGAAAMRFCSDSYAMEIARGNPTMEVAGFALRRSFEGASIEEIHELLYQPTRETAARREEDRLEQELYLAYLDNLRENGRQ